MLDCVAACIGNQSTDLRSNNPDAPWRFPLQLFLLTTDHDPLWGEVRGWEGNCSGGLFVRRTDWMERRKSLTFRQHSWPDFTTFPVFIFRYVMQTRITVKSTLTPFSVMHNYELLGNNYILRIPVKDARPWEVSNSEPRKFLANRARAITFALRSAASFDSRSHNATQPPVSQRN